MEPELLLEELDIVEEKEEQEEEARERKEEEERRGLWGRERWGKEGREGREGSRRRLEREEVRGRGPESTGPPGPPLTGGVWPRDLLGGQERDCARLRWGGLDRNKLQGQNFVLAAL